jgi:phosphoglycerol transferase MdoB-like AlkP superfamily enzyme
MNILTNSLRAILAFLKPSPNRPFFALLALYSVVQLTFLSVVFYKHEFKMADYTVALYFIEKFVFDFAVFLTRNLIHLRVVKKTVPSMIFSILYLILIAVNTLVYYFSSTLLELHHFSLITPYSLAGFVSPRSILIAAVFVVAAVLLRYPIRRIAVTCSWKAIVRWTLLCAAIGLSHIPRHISELKKSDERLDKVIMVFRNAQLEYSAQNPVASFVNDIVLRGFFENLYTMKGSDTYLKYMKDYNLLSGEYTVSNDIKPFAKTIRRYKLPIGKREYEDLNLEQFRRVIIIFAESLSLDFLHCYNSKMNLPVTPWLCSDKVRAQTFNNMMTSGSPTLQGLTVSYSSHPNYNIQKLTGDRNSLMKILRKNGFENHFIRSASKFFANENIVFKKWGFDRIQAREDFFRRPDLKKYIYGWGLEDRILYDEIVDFLDKNRNKKIFISALGTDTHPLHGQRHFKHLEYPALPLDFNKTFGRARNFMKAVHHTDHDLKRFIERLKDKGLYTRETLVVITTDHSCPPNVVTRAISGSTRQSLGKIPFILLTPQELPGFNNDTLTSQLDLAPTLLHLMNIPVPRGYWGDSLFHQGKRNPAVGFHRNIVTIDSGNKKTYVNLKRMKTPTDKSFYELFSTIIEDK